MDINDIREGKRAANRKYHAKVREAWRQGIVPTKDYAQLLALTKRSERLVAEAILPSLGFTDIVWLDNRAAAFDILAVSPTGVRYAVDVTLAAYKGGNPARSNGGNRRALDWLVRNLGLLRLTVFVSPNLARYVVKERAQGASSFMTLTEVNGASMTPQLQEAR